MRLCNACRGSKKGAFSDKNLPPHSAPCSGSVAPINTGSPLCQCPCTSMDSKPKLEEAWRHRRWLEATDRHPVTDIQVERLEWPYEADIVLTFVENEHNADVIRLSPQMQTILREVMNQAPVLL